MKLCGEVVDEKRVIQEITEKLNKLFGDKEGFELRKSPQKTRADVTFDVFYAGKITTLLVEVKSSGQPRHLRDAIYQLKKHLLSIPDSYGIIGAPYISEQGLELLKENGIGYIDLSDNAYINTSSIYIRIAGNPNKYPTTRPQKTLFSPKSSRVIRMLLSYPQKCWYVKELANELSLSLGQASNIKRILLDEEFAIEQNQKFCLNNAGKLLDLWSESYTYRKNDIKNYYTILSLENAEEKIAQYCNTHDIKYALTMFSGASRIAPFARYSRSFIYTNDVERIANELGLKPVEEGANITFLIPYDDGVYNANQKVDNIKVVSDIQLYLDLVGFKGRGVEQADVIRKQRIGY